MPDVQVENMNLSQIESLVSAYLHCKDAEKILNNAGSFIYTEADLCGTDRRTG